MEPDAIDTALGKNGKVAFEGQEVQDVQQNLFTFASFAVLQRDTYIANSCKTEIQLLFYNV